jgi:hypothetical protein
MHLVVGPILQQFDGYAYDSWVPEFGVRRSYSYRRIEDAYYARKCAVAEAARSNRAAPIICHTAEEFALTTGGSWARATAA